MDSYLTGREKLGGEQKAKDAPAILPQSALQKLNSPLDESAIESCSEQGEAGSQVEYVTQDGRVTRIVVTCACGQVTEIDCAYEE